MAANLLGFGPKLLASSNCIECKSHFAIPRPKEARPGDLERICETMSNQVQRTHSLTRGADLQAPDEHGCAFRNS